MTRRPDPPRHSAPTVIALGPRAAGGLHTPSASQAPAPPRPSPPVELHVRSNFTFLDGASHPEELVTTAAALGYRAVAITDRNTLAGVVRAHTAARDSGLTLVVGCELALQADATAGETAAPPGLLCFPTDREDYGTLCQLITVGRRRAPKGQCHLTLGDVRDHDRRHLYAVLPPLVLDVAGEQALEQALLRLIGLFGRERLWLAAAMAYRGDDLRRLAVLDRLASRHRLPLLATNAVRFHSPGRKRLADVMACIREGVTIHNAGPLMAANAERHLKAPDEMVRLFRHYPHALVETTRLAERCRFSLDDLKYNYPSEVQGETETAQQRLERLTWAGAAWRFGDGVPPAVAETLERELALIAQLNYAPYFLTVEDIVRFARERGILAQGRGSAANSAVCFVLGVTSVDPTQMDLLFARFISAERNEPPDIDIDFEHERREEVLQYIYTKYGRHRTGMTATVNCYRARGALREVAKAMGLSGDVIDRLTGTVWGSWGRLETRHIAGEGIDLDDPLITDTLDLAAEIQGFPRHLSQHTGGMVISEEPLERIVPIQNAAMADRTVIEWDKDDLDQLKMIKVDILGLGMLSCLARSLVLMERHYQLKYNLATLPAEDPAVYQMLCRADSIGVFQVESRAQMTMLPRLRPQCFYDLVIEVAIVRPGPIQGDMVHPYLRRRQGKEEVSYPSDDLRQVLSKTLGVPLFQEQVMKIAIVAAGFSDSEADQLRRAMATFRKMGIIGSFERKMIDGMIARGYQQDFAERVFKQVQGFGEYGFPESHAASFALLVYASAWIKCHYPDVFCCALLNSQPMGFYAPAQLVGDARAHGVEVRPVDVNHSAWDCTLEVGSAARRAVRLGLRQIQGLARADGERLVAARASGYRDVADLARRAGVSRRGLELLAAADAFASVGLERRQAAWAVRALDQGLFHRAAALPLFEAALAPPPDPDPRPGLAETQQSLLPIDDGAEALPVLGAGAQVVADYRLTGLSLRQHPMAFVRAQLNAEGLVTSRDLPLLRSGRKVVLAGIVLVRQRPGTAHGTMFITLEDETGVANVVVFPAIGEQYRRPIMTSRLLRVRGRVENAEGIIHLIASEITDDSALLGHLVEDGGRQSRSILNDPKSFQ